MVIHLSARVTGKVALTNPDIPGHTTEKAVQDHVKMSELNGGKRFPGLILIGQFPRNVQENAILIILEWRIDAYFLHKPSEIIPKIRINT